MEVLTLKFIQNIFEFMLGKLLISKIQDGRQNVGKICPICHITYIDVK